ncbi:MAG: MFS transporter [Ruminococcaceae bacterium]|nr:MFS transporter [Oscillospiraceae bacterium]
MKKTITPPASAGAEWTSRRINRCATQLFLFCFLSYACSYLGRKNLAACVPDMIDEGFLTKDFAAVILPCFMLAYGAGQFINGIVGTKIRPKFMVAIGLGGATICSLAMGLAPVATIMPFIWALNGLFNSMLWAPLLRTVTNQLPIERRSGAGTGLNAACSVGAIMAFLIPGFLLSLGGWRFVFYMTAGILFACFLTWTLGNAALSKYTKMMDEACRIERAALIEKADAEAAAQNKKKRSRSLPAVIAASGLWVVVFGLFCNGALRDAVESWAPTFLSEKFNMDSSMAAITSVLIPIISLSGTYIANWLNEKFIRNELYTSFIMFAVAALCIGGLFACRNLHFLPCIIFMAVSVSCMWGANLMFLTTIPYHFATLDMSAAVTGMFNSMIYIATALSTFLYGILSERFGWNVMILVWLGIGAFGAVVCLVFARFWGKKAALLDEGKI